MEENFKELKDKINHSKEAKEIEEIIKEWEVKPEDYDKWVDKIFSEEIFEIDIHKIPYVIESLYKQNDKLKFAFCCMMLEATYEELPFITNLEDIPIFREKFKMFAGTLCNVACRSYNGIADCMYLILLQIDPTGSLLTPDQKTMILQSVNDKLAELISYITKNTKIEENVYKALEIILDVSCYIKDNETVSFIKEIENLPLNVESKLFLIKTQAVNGISVNQLILEELLQKENCIYRLVKILEGIDQLSILPKDRITQQEIAKSFMIDWLKYPTELGEEPAQIELVDCLELEENEVVYIYQFLDKKHPEKGNMIGISGGFEKGKITSNNTGLTFSNFETITEDYQKQARDMIALITQYWKNRNNNEK